VSSWDDAGVPSCCGIRIERTSSLPARESQRRANEKGGKGLAKLYAMSKRNKLLTRRTETGMIGLHGIVPVRGSSRGPLGQGVCEEE
jgi:hypothetical protein